MNTRTKVLLLLAAFCPMTSIAAPGDIYAQVMASPLAPTWLSPGHAFICISYHLNSGIKEECYGFYKSPDSNAVFVGAPALANEFKQNPKRFSQISWSLQKKISPDKVRAFQAVVDRVSVGSYSLTENNCGDFVSDAVSALGWDNVTKGVLPEPYVRALYFANIKRFVRPGRTFQRTGRQSWVSERGTPFLQTAENFSAGYIELKDLTTDPTKVDQFWRFPVRGGPVTYFDGTFADVLTGTIYTPEFD